MFCPRLQNRSGVDVKDLHFARVVACHEDLAILANVSASSDIAESCNGLDELAGAVGVDLDSGASRDDKRIAVVGDVCDGVARWRRDEELVFKGFPVSLLCGKWRWAIWQFELWERSHLSRCHCRCVALAIFRDVCKLNDLSLYRVQVTVVGSCNFFFLPIEDSMRSTKAERRGGALGFICNRTSAIPTSRTSTASSITYERLTSKCHR